MRFGNSKTLCRCPLLKLRGAFPRLTSSTKTHLCTASRYTQKDITLRTFERVKRCQRPWGSHKLNFRSHWKRIPSIQALITSDTTSSRGFSPGFAAKICWSCEQSSELYECAELGHHLQALLYLWRIILKSLETPSWAESTLSSCEKARGTSSACIFYMSQ